MTLPSLSYISERNNQINREMQVKIIEAKQSKKNLYQGYKGVPEFFSQRLIYLACCVVVDQTFT